MTRRRSCRHAIALGWILLNVHPSVIVDASRGTIRTGATRTTTDRRLKTRLFEAPQEDEPFWHNVFLAGSSLETNFPSATPSLSPTNETSSTPTSTPTSPPTAMSTPEDPTVAPTQPTLSPTVATIPTTIPTALPTEPPTAEPTSTPTEEPTSTPKTPTSEPTRAPQCALELTHGCVTTTGGIECEDIVREESLSCECEDCIRGLLLMFTGNPCSDVDGLARQCVDSTAIVSPARVLVTIGEESLFDQFIEFGDFIEVNREDGECLLEPVTLSVLSSVDNSTMQTIQLGTVCDEAEGLTLTEPYGAFDYVGYSCNETDVHNCLVDVGYFIGTCNTISPLDFILFDIELTTTEGGTYDYLEGSSVSFLEPRECQNNFRYTTIERCFGKEYVSFVSVNASSSGFTGPYCQIETALIFDTSRTETNSSLR